MRIETYKLEFLTPCFCAGADQSVSELRATAIRGQLRWWFRALGGSAADEIVVFGGISRGEDKTPVASKIVIRVRNVSPGPDWNKPDFTANDMCSYVWHFARVSGLDSKSPDYEKKRGGPRWRNDAFFPPQTRFELQIVYRQKMSETLLSRFKEALKCFLSLGAIGMRVTRGLGGFLCKEHYYDDSVKAILISHDFAVEERSASEVNVYDRIGALVKGTRKKFSWKNSDDVQTPSPFGSSNPRQMSAVYFRLVKKEDGKIALVVFAAPYERVLSLESRKEPKPLVGVHTNLSEYVANRRR